MDKDKFVLVVFSGDMDKVLSAFILATTAASMGMEVKMFFTFWGLNVLRKKKLTSGRNWLQKTLNFINRSGYDRLPLSKFNMLGIGPLVMKKLMDDARIPSIEDFLGMAKQMGIKLMVCTTTFSFMGHKKEDFIDGVDEYCGAAAYLQEAREAKMSYFI